MATISWMLGTGGAWDQQANWVGGVAPGSADTAVISTAAAATIVVGAGNFTVGRLITAATDTFSISGGNWTDNGASTLGGAFGLSSGSATFNGATRIFGAANITGGTFTVGAGATVTATGGGALAGTITGPGTLTTGGNFTAGSANGTAMFIGQDITWNNGGTASLIGPIYQGIASVSETSVINNLSGASFNFASDSASIFAQYIAGTFNNFGTLAKTGGTGTSTVGAFLNNTGAIQVSSGTLNLTGGGAISGSESGAGLLRIASPVTLNTGASIAGAMQVVGSLVTAGTATVSGSLTVSGGQLSVAAGATLTASGGAVFDGQATFGGPGTLVTSGTVTLVPTGSFIFMGQGLTWNNIGTVNAMGVLSEGIGSASETFTLNNAAGASFNFTNDAASITQQYIAGTFNNAGILAKTGGTGTSIVQANVVSTGSIVVSTGILSLARGATLSGSIGGAGTLAFAGGASSIAAGTDVTVGALAVSGGVLTLAETIPGAIVETGGNILVAASVGVGGLLSVSGGQLSVATGATLTASGGAVFAARHPSAGRARWRPAAR